MSSWGYRHLIRPLLFQFQPETMHTAAMTLSRMAGRPPLNWLTRSLFGTHDTKHAVTVFRLTFPNRIGLAAGFDKDGTAWRGLANLGFGHLEIGTVTPRPQSGNPKPRNFRLPIQNALINRMGFPGVGAEAVLKNLPAPGAPRKFVLGINIGKNKTTPLEAAADDYTSLVKSFAPVADYLAVNISSPNTEGLRRLQGRNFLDELLRAIISTRDAESVRLNRRLPLLVKLAPDLTDAELDDALSVMLDRGVDGVIATNTTIGRAGVENDPGSNETGGLSGRPLREHATRMIEKIVARSQERLPVIGVGGIDSVESAQEKLDAGAALIQVYTGLIYQGPGLIKRLVSGVN
ncbi:MAG: quinone-dependent dihydroorotate dehydrogenase [Candidatus Marinimicrobia bacterium]|nr:quinone-dependent dihydroorotate dehydrogenase [Candidatus Neomarinimicrobiota bacterium]